MRNQSLSHDPSSLSSKTTTSLLSGSIRYGKPILLPVLFALIPTLYHYSNNVEILTFENLSRMLILNGVLAAIVYFLLLVFSRFNPIQAATAAFVFLIFFNVYGLAYKYLLRLDVVRMEHYTFLPLVLMATLYAILFVWKLNESLLLRLWKNLYLVVSVLIVFNIINIAPKEVRRWQSDRAMIALESQPSLAADSTSPDIYYIVLDEFAGLQAMREYWHYNDVDQFANFLTSRGFFVAEQSHSHTRDTLHEIASRLNYQNYPFDTSREDFMNAIAYNRVMQYLKLRGYTTVVFDETKLAYFSSKPIRADHLYQYGDESIPHSQLRTSGLFLDDFGSLVMDNTMYSAIASPYKDSTRLMDWHNSMVRFTVQHVADQTIDSPKFVYVHLLLPHPPFIFTPTGGVDGSHLTNWNYYLDTYIFSIRVAEQMVTNILQNSDPSNPPVIILQSDHGARNSSENGGEILPNYPEELKTSILYTLYLPGYDTSKLPQDIDPIQTFPLVLNYLFHEDISVSK